jgi:imidazolonepropionase-like amidohydrolase
VASELILDAIDGKLPVRIEANNNQIIAAALELAREHSLSLLIAGGAGATGHAEAMADLGVGVILDLSRQLAGDGKLAADFKAYQKAGVSVALGSGGRDLGPMLLTLAGELIAEGVDQDAVWKSLTSTPADLLGLGGKAGAVQRGASGSMILFGGASPFDASAPFRTHTPK